MSDREYMTFFHECLEHHNITNDKYLPVKDYLFKIIDYFYYKGGFEDTSKGEWDLVYPDWVSDLLTVFDKIMEENKYDHLDEYINFILNLDHIYLSFPGMLATILFKDQLIPNLKRVGKFNHFMNTLCFDSIFFEDIDNFKSDTKIVQILKLYAKYYNEYMRLINRPYYADDLDKYNFDKRAFYFNMGELAAAETYLYDIDIKGLDAFLHDLIYNYEATKEYLILNGLYKEIPYVYEIDHLKEMLENYGSQDINIK